ncbi:hypothetical protein EMIT0196MI5_120151 [Pseudomonas sp. IT-196MI5]
MTWYDLWQMMGGTPGSNFNVSTSECNQQVPEYVSESFRSCTQSYRFRGVRHPPGPEPSGNASTRFSATGEPAAA